MAKSAKLRGVLSSFDKYGELTGCSGSADLDVIPGSTLRGCSRSNAAECDAVPARDAHSMEAKNNGCKVSSGTRRLVVATLREAAKSWMTIINSSTERISHVRTARSYRD